MESNDMELKPLMTCKQRWAYTRKHT